MRRRGQTSRERKERKHVEPRGANARSVSGRGNDDGVGAAQTRAGRNPSSDRKIAAKRIPYGVVFAAGRPNTVVPRSGQEPETPKIRPNAVWPWPHFRPPTRLPASAISPSGKGQVQRRNRNTKQKTIKKTGRPLATWGGFEGRRQPTKQRSPKSSATLGMRPFPREPPCQASVRLHKPTDSPAVRLA